MLTALALFIMAFGLSSQKCGSVKDHQEIYDAYFTQHGEILGKGGFGKVRQFVFKRKLYAVKEISITLHEKLQEKIDNAPSKIKTAVKDFHEMMDSFPFFETLFEDEIVAEFISEKYADDLDIQDWVWNYYLIMKEVVKDANQEVEVSEKLSQAFDGVPNAMAFKFHYCIRETGLKMHLFFDKYGDEMDSMASQAFILQKRMDERFEMYLQILRRIRNIHGQGVVHCDIKPANILWTTKSRRDFVIIDYGLANFGQKCAGGTRGFQAPELTIKGDLDKQADAFKADVYSFAMMVANSELTRVNPTFSIVRLQREYQLKQDLYDHHQEILSTLHNYCKKAQEITSAFNPRLRVNYATFYGEMRRVFDVVLATNASRRTTLNYAYRHFWYLFQMSRFLTEETKKFNDIWNDLRKYLQNYQNKKDFFTLPIEWKPFDDENKQVFEEYERI